jgi:mRNA interferase MazF
LQAKRSVTVVVLPAGTAGLPQPSVVLCHQVTTLDRRKLVQRIGSLPTPSMKEVEAALRAALDLDDPR